MQYIQQLFIFVLKVENILVRIISTYLFSFVLFQEHLKFSLFRIELNHKFVEFIRHPFFALTYLVFIWLILRHCVLRIQPWLNEIVIIEKYACAWSLTYLNKIKLARKKRKIPINLPFVFI